MNPRVAEIELHSFWENGGFAYDICTAPGGVMPFGVT